ncbi:MAG TPA: hypothetical protein EYO02_06925 [Rhodospirillales bacterium]|nr:hypothetical protein [Rhodospirillales bacterium]
MANSGILWIDFVFNTSVSWLYAWGEFLGITYEEINVWIFCIIWPALTLGMMIFIVFLIRSNRRLKSIKV